MPPLSLPPNARVGASAFSSYEGTFTSFVDMIRSAGYNGVELRNFIGTRTSVMPDRAPEIKRILDEHSLRATLHLPAHLNLVDPDDQARQHCFHVYEKGILAAHLVGADVVVIHGGMHPDLERGYYLSCEALALLSQQAADYGVRLALENSENAPEKLFCHPDDFERVASLENLFFVMDVGHLATMGFTIADALRYDVIRSRLVEVHLHDNDKKLDHHWALGEGDIDLPSAFDALAECGFEGVYTVEAKSTPGLIKSAEYLRLAETTRAGS